MRSLFICLVILVGFSGCVRKNKVPTAQNAANPSQHEVKVEEVVQTSNYTYLKVSENGAENWLAVTRMQAANGETYFYNQAMEMKNFNSKELNRTFPSIYFVQEISKEPIIGGIPTPATHNGKGNIIKGEGISVAPAAGSVSIAELFAKKDSYSGKTIKMKGQVVKINNEVMGKNWIHIQDGTGTSNDFDLTVTTLDKAAVGDVVTFEGPITLKKDFGYGYFYEVIMDGAKLVK
jgi:hypothetical protein